MKDMTSRQREILAFITEYLAAHAYPPTIREIAEYFDISIKGAYDHLAALKKKGRIRGDKRSRSLEIVKSEHEADSEGFIQVPLLGTVAAGLPILAEQNWEGMIHVHQSHLKKNAQYFALTIRGDSMRDAGIMDGDTAIVQKQETALNGDIVVAMVDDAMTVKRFFREQGKVRLQPENASFKPIFSKNVRVQGRVIHVFRDL